MTSREKRIDEYARRSPMSLASMLVDVEDELEKAHGATARALGLTKAEYHAKRLSRVIKRSAKACRRDIDFHKEGLSHEQRAGESETFS